ncbi:hypothetical protein [Ktedonospora formicarum]|nr:hypothetical protein [Ktedonospora formicarum]
MSRASSAAECPCGATCTAEGTLREMMETMEQYHCFEREDVSIATILTDLQYTATVMDTCLHHWSEAVQTCETGRANLALGTGTYLRPSVPTRALVEREERALQRW